MIVVLTLIALIWPPPALPLLFGGRPSVLTQIHLSSTSSWDPLVVRGLVASDKPTLQLGKLPLFLVGLVRHGRRICFISVIMLTRELV